MKIKNIAIVLNWNAANATMCCVESILNFAVNIDCIVVVDNCSEDDSFEKLTKRAEISGWESVYVVGNHINSGYAGGNNFGIDFAVKTFPEARVFWIVNNDAYLESDAFSPMLTAVTQDLKVICGSVIVDSASRKVECFGGGKLYPFLGKARLVGSGASLEGVSKFKSVPDYIMGCSMAFDKSLVDEVGYMDESYFMYSEELDWQFRAREKKFYIKVCPDSVVMHLGSMSSGGRGWFYHYYRNRAAVMFNRRFYGFSVALISVFMLSMFSVCKEFLRPRIMISGIKGSIAGLFKRFGDD